LPPDHLLFEIAGTKVDLTLFEGEVIYRRE